ncbi:MAG: HD domain-containing protein [Acidobacteriota bacterium]
MAQFRRNEAIRDWESGDGVQGFALVTKKEVRQDRNNRTFVDLEIADETGTMAGKIWSDSPALEGDFDAHDFVAFRGLVKLYRDQLQLTIDECRRATEEDRRYGFDESKLVPSTHEDIDQLYQTLETLLGSLERPILARLASETLAVYGERLRVHPAAKVMHHAYRGGLLEHVVSMAELADQVSAHYGDLDRDLLLLGVLFHDLGKLDELGAMPANDYTLEGRLIGHVVIGRDMVRERCAAIADFPADLQIQLEHLVLAHQGRKEYSSPVEPTTPEALVLHFIDDLDSKLNQFIRHRAEGTGMVWHRGLGRHVYLPEVDAKGTAEGEPPKTAEEAPVEPPQESTEAAPTPQPASLFDEPAGDD